MSTTVYLGITKLDQGLKYPEVVVNAALDALDAAVGSPPRARVYHNANQSIANNTLTALNFNSERFDTDVIHDTSTNNNRLTCKTAGTYLIILNALFDVHATGWRLFSIRLNGSTTIADTRAQAITVGSIGTAGEVSTVYSLAVNDYVEAMVLQTSGGSLNILASGNFTPEFMCIRLGS